MTTPRTPNDKEKGSALVIAIFALFLVASMGIAVLFLADSDVKMNKAGVRSKTAFYLAEAGLEDARKALRAANMASLNRGSLSDELVTAAGSGGVIQADPTTIAPVYDASGQVTGFTGYGNDVPLRPFTPFGDGSYAAFLTNDSVDGWTSTTDGNDRVIITAIGAGTDRSVEIVQAVVELDGFSLPATITILGPPPTTFSAGSSSSKVYSGDDCVGVTGATGVANLHMPVIGTIGTASQAFVQANIAGPTFTSGTYSGANTVDDSTSTSDPRWSVTIDPILTNCSTLRGLTDRMKASADYVCTAASPCSHWATSTTSTITYVDGNLTAPPAGKGILVVNGQLSFNGSDLWEGPIFVVGTGQFTRTGGGSGHTWGGIVVANIAGPDGVFGNGDDCTGGTGGFGAVSFFNTNGGGNHDTVYCTDLINLGISALALRVQDFRQR
jgi:hypothetical protein